MSSPLDARIAEMTRKGWRVESHSGSTATLVKGKKIRHWIHLLLSIPTLGIWAVVVWLPIWLKSRGTAGRRVLSLEDGQVVEGRARGGYAAIRRGQ